MVNLKETLLKITLFLVFNNYIIPAIILITLMTSEANCDHLSADTESSKNIDLGWVLVNVYFITVISYTIWCHL